MAEPILQPTKHAGLNWPGRRSRPPVIPVGDPIETLRKELAKILRASVTRPPLTFREFLETRLTLPDGPHRGKRFRIERQPVIGLWADAVDSGYWTEFVFTAPSQFGKTLAAFCGPILWHTCELDDNTVMGVPYGDMAADKWKMDLVPVLRSSPELRKLQPISGSGSAGGKVRDLITLSNGIVIKPMSAGAADTGKAGFTSRVLIVTEAAGFSEAGEASVESDPLRQLRARQRAFRERERATFIEGTLTIEDELPWSLREHSTQSAIVSPCVHCGKWVAPEREDLLGWQQATTEMEARELSHWSCPDCKTAITEAERRDMLLDSILLHRGQRIDKRGRVTGPLPETSRLWFHAKAFHNLFLEAGDIGKDEWLAAQITEETVERYSADKQLAQFVHAQPYVSPLFAADIELDRRAINARRSQLPAQVLPEDTELLTLACDVGEKKLWYCFLALRRDEAGNIYYHVPAYGDVDVPSERMPLARAIRTALEQVHSIARAGFVVAGSSVVRVPDQEWYDSRHESDAVLGFIRETNASEYDQLTTAQRKYQPVVGAYGNGNTMARTPRYLLPKKTGNEVRDIDPAGLWYTIRSKRGGTYAVFWDADISKRQVQHALSLRDVLAGQQGQTPGSITLYSGTARIHERFARHMVNEQLKRDARTGKMKWERVGDNHLLDCMAMAWRAMDRARHCLAKLGVHRLITERSRAPKPAKPKAPRTVPAPIRDLPPVPAKKANSPTPKSNWYGD